MLIHTPDITLRCFAQACTSSRIVFVEIKIFIQLLIFFHVRTERLDII